MLASKIDDLTLFTMVMALAASWLVAVVGLAFTVERKYLRTFVSLQTGYANTQAYFLDNEGDDARRIWIFFHNERQWRAIRSRVRLWVLGMYAAWLALMPAWLTDLRARIPDDFMPVQVVHDLNAQAPGGRRPTMKDMGLVRRMSHTIAVPADDSSNSDEGVRVPAPRHLRPTSSQSVEGLQEGAANEERVEMAGRWRLGKPDTRKPSIARRSMLELGTPSGCRPLCDLEGPLPLDACAANIYHQGRERSGGISRSKRARHVPVAHYHEPHTHACCRSSV
jgi:hypothetical protein